MLREGGSNERQLIVREQQLSSAPLQPHAGLCSMELGAHYPYTHGKWLICSRTGLFVLTTGSSRQSVTIASIVAAKLSDSHRKQPAADLLSRHGGAPAAFCAAAACINAAPSFVIRNMRVRATEEGSEGTHWYDRPCGPNSLEVSSVQELVDVLVRIIQAAARTERSWFARQCACLPSGC